MPFRTQLQGPALAVNEWMEMDLLDLLLDHDRWATATLLEASRTLSDAELDQPFDVGHRTLRETFGHMIFNVPFWTARLNGHPTEGILSADRQPKDRSVAALRDHHERASQAFASIARHSATRDGSERPSSTTTTSASRSAARS